MSAEDGTVAFRKPKPFRLMAAAHGAECADELAAVTEEHVRVLAQVLLAMYGPAEVTEDMMRAALFAITHGGTSAAEGVREALGSE
ncbi:MAG TPA: hypothetical protein VKD22_02225 [Ramlibacter sp.]|nr:hypothetical protein [Ramlibacter sp.]